MFICSQWVTLLHFWTLSLKENQKCELIVIKDQQHLFPSMLLRQTSDKLIFTTLQRRSTCSKRWEECTDPQQCTALKNVMYTYVLLRSHTVPILYLFIFLRTLRLVFHITLALFLFFRFVCLLHFLNCARFAINPNFAFFSLLNLL